MSVKFEKKEATVRAIGEKTEDLAHQVGQSLTGGKSKTGYLAVGFHSTLPKPPFAPPAQPGLQIAFYLHLTNGIGLPRTAAVEPDADEDAYVRYLVCTSGI